MLGESVKMSCRRPVPPDVRRLNFEQLSLRGDLIPQYPLPLTSIDAKRKVDGTAAADRLKTEVSERWVSERFRQTMYLVLEAREHWPNQSLLSADDYEAIRVTVDGALSVAVSTNHVADLYDLNPTVWGIWLIQNSVARRMGGSWAVVGDEAAQAKLSFDGIYRFFEAQAARGEEKTLYDPVTNARVARYRLPFRQMRVPINDRDMYRYKAGARRLSSWITQWQRLTYTPAEMEMFTFEGLHPQIVAQQPPDLLPAPPAQNARTTAAQRVWQRVAERARAAPTRSVRGLDGDIIRAASAAAAAQTGGSSSGGSSSAGSTPDANQTAAPDREMDRLEALLLANEDSVTEVALAALRTDPQVNLDGLIVAVAGRLGIRDASAWRDLITGVRLAFRASRAAAAAPAPAP